MDNVLQTFRKERHKKKNDECRKQVFTINSFPDVKGVWGMDTEGNPESATAMIHKITLFKLKIVIIVKHCYSMYFQYAKMMRIFQKYTRQTGASGNISPMNKKKHRHFLCFQACGSRYSRLFLWFRNFEFG